MAAQENKSPGADPGISPARSRLDRISSFRVTYLAVITFVFLYLFSVKAVEAYLQIHFEHVVADSISGGPLTEPVEVTIRRQLYQNVVESSWVRVWEARVAVTVIARDSRTVLYVNGNTPRLMRPADRAGQIRQRERLLPATAIVSVSVPHTSLLSNAVVVFYASLLFTGLFAYNRHIVSLENRIIDDALAERDRVARRAEQIDREIQAVRERARAAEPEESEYREEIAQLNVQRSDLERQLRDVTARERELRGKAELATRLELEGQALEDLLDEASSDLEAKDAAIRELETSLKRAIKAGGSDGSREK